MTCQLIGLVACKHLRRVPVVVAFTWHSCCHSASSVTEFWCCPVRSYVMVFISGVIRQVCVPIGHGDETSPICIFQATATAPNQPFKPQNARGTNRNHPRIVPCIAFEKVEWAVQHRMVVPHEHLQQNEPRRNPPHRCVAGDSLCRCQRHAKAAASREERHADRFNIGQ